MTDRMLVQVERMSFHYPETTDPWLYRDFTLPIAEGARIALMGPTGTGKSTLARLIARQVLPDAGCVQWQQGLAVRDVGYLDQDPMNGLWPWQRVSANIEFPLTRLGWSGPQLRSRVDEMLELVGLTHRARAFPLQLSGGERQRAALARHLSWKPRLLILDESFSALDAVTRRHVIENVRIQAMRQATTILFVTHDLLDAQHLCTRAMVLGGAPAVVVEEVPLPGQLGRSVAAEQRILTALSWGMAA